VQCWSCCSGRCLVLSRVSFRYVVVEAAAGRRNSKGRSSSGEGKQEQEVYAAASAGMRMACCRACIIMVLYCRSHLWAYAAVRTVTLYADMCHVCDIVMFTCVVLLVLACKQCVAMCHIAMCGVLMCWVLCVLSVVLSCVVVCGAVMCCVVQACACCDVPYMYVVDKYLPDE